MSNQTQSFLMRRFAEVGIHPKSKHGQNFLIDLNLVRLLVESAELSTYDVVLEIGTGTGSLTGLMAPRVAAVVSIEVDPQMHMLASEELIDQKNVTLMLTDVLQNKNHFNRTVLETIAARFAEAPGRRFKLAANLPYNVATPIISNLLLLTSAPGPESYGIGPPETMTVTIQKELADRILAGPGTKDYGALSVWVQSQCEATLVRIMPPTVFWPRPKVHSAIIHLRYRPELRAQIADLDFFHRCVRKLFFHRRKFLRSVLIAGFKAVLDKPAVDAIMAQMNFTATTRTEELDVATILRLTDLLREATGGQIEL
jgi:16S rRNA (adenine1518-N6/adenine1519-N6)-dimethyltransferase